MSTTKAPRNVSQPDVCGGKPCVSGTRVRVQDIFVWHELQGKSADEIVSRFPALPMAVVYGALEYYWDHRDDRRRQMQEESELVEQMKQKYPSRLQDKLAGKDGANNPLPPG